LEDFPLNLSERQSVFEAAAQALAAHAKPALAVPVTPQSLEDDVFISPLHVVVAAYLAVHGVAELPKTRGELFDELLHHEQRYWMRSALAHGLQMDPMLQRRVVAFATLAGADSEDEATDLLRLVPNLEDASAERRGALARWLANLYPDGNRFWSPLEPDLVGERLVVTTYTEHPAVLSGALKRGAPQAIVQPLDVYARAAADHPELEAALSRILTDLLGELCELAVTEAVSYADLDVLLGGRTLAAAMNRALRVISVDAARLPAILDALPARSNLVLNSLVLRLTWTLTDDLRRRSSADRASYEPTLALSLNNLSLRLAAVGHREESLAAIEEAVTVYGCLASADPESYESRLALSLNNLSIGLAEAGRLGEGLATIEEAVGIFRRLASANPAAYEADLAGLLSNFSLRLREAGRLVEGLGAIEEAVNLGRRLASANPIAYEPELAGSLSNLSNLLAALGRHRESLAAVEEAVGILRRLATADQARYESKLAALLTNLSVQLPKVCRSGEGLAAIEEAVTVYRRLAIGNPAAYEPYLARTLSNLSIDLAEVGRHQEALAAIQEAVSLRERLATANPAAYNGDLTRSLNDLFVRLAECGGNDESP
jgi:tetratricopeptide (TPR) repeat protein